MWAYFGGKGFLGREISKTAPLPGPDLTVIFPPCLFTMMSYEMDKPKPDPFPGSFVVKNGSNILFRMFSGMPGPSSAMLQ